MAENKEYTPIYYESPAKAYRESWTSPEAEAFRASFDATEECVNDIHAAIIQNRSGTGMFSSTNFIEGLIDKHGRERIKYCLASYVRSRENESPYFTDDVKSWAHGIRISDSRLIANTTIIIDGGDDLVNALAEELRLRDIYEEKESDATEGDSEKDYNIEDSEKADAIKPTKVDVPEAGEKTQANKNVTKNSDGSVTVIMPTDAVVKRNQTLAVLCMPRNRGYDMFRYIVDIECFRENGDGTVSVTMATNDTHTLTIRRRGQEVELSADKLYDAFSGATREDYIPVKYTVEIPVEAVRGNYLNMICCKFPADSMYRGQHIVIPSIFKDEAKSNDEKIVFSIPDYTNFSVRNTEGDAILISVSAVAAEFDEGSLIKRDVPHIDKLPYEEYEDGGFTLTLPKCSAFRRYEKDSVFSMPKGVPHEGYRFVLLEDKITELDDGSFKLRFNGNEDITLIKPQSFVTIPQKKLLEELKMASTDDFKTVFHEIEVPKDALFGNYPTFTRVYMPDDGPYKGMNAVIPNAYKIEGDGDNETLKFSIPENLDISVKRGFGSAALGSEVFISGKELYEIAKSVGFSDRKSHVNVSLPDAALLHKYDKDVLFKMPTACDYPGFTYKVPSDMVSMTENGEIKLSLPKTLTVNVKKPGESDFVEMKSSELVQILEGKTIEDYLWKRGQGSSQGK